MIKFPDFVLQGKPPLEVPRPIMSYPQHNSVILLSALFLLQSSQEIFTKLVHAQTDDDQSSVTYPRFSRTMAIVVVVIMSLFFVMAFIVIYIRHCTGLSSGGAPSIRSRRANAAARGLDPSVIETFPTFTYSEVKEHKLGKGALECAVCLNEFEEDETLRFIPRCDHVFHPECIDAWLMAHVTCPVCRANLVPQHGDDHVKVPELTQVRHDEIAIEVDNDEINQPQAVSPTRNQTPPRSWSIQRLGSLGFGKFRSDSTGHDNNDGMMVVVQPGANLERFTLRLPEKMRKQMMLRRSKSHIGTSSLPRSRSGEGSKCGGVRFYRRINDRRSDGWAFLRRALSMPATRLPPKVVAEAGTEGRGGRTMTMTMSPVKMPSFKCLEPKATDDQTDVALFPAGDRCRIASGVGVPSQSINQP